jgi:hypothetical protein
MYFLGNFAKELGQRSPTLPTKAALIIANMSVDWIEPHAQSAVVVLDVFPSQLLGFR